MPQSLTRDGHGYQMDGSDGYFCMAPRLREPRFVLYFGLARDFMP